MAITHAKPFKKTHWENRIDVTLYNIIEKKKPLKIFVFNFLMCRREAWDIKETKNWFLMWHFLIS